MPCTHQVSRNSLMDLHVPCARVALPRGRQKERVGGRSSILDNLDRRGILGQKTN